MKIHSLRLNRRGASVMTTALLVGLIAIVAIAALSRLGGNVSILFARTGNTLITVNNMAGATTGAVNGGSGSGGSGPTGGPFNSCKAMKDANATMTGIAQQTITIAGTPRQIICDMSTYGGGWTLIAAQFDSNPLGWNAGLGAQTYVPALTDKTSFVFSSAQIPSHTQIAFGRIQPGGGGGYTAHMIDAVTRVYTTGDINPPVSVTSINSGQQYWIHRAATGFYNCHEIDGSCAVTGMNGAGANSWAFSPEFSQQTYRGFSYQGDLQGSNEAFAWAVWVR